MRAGEAVLSSGRQTERRLDLHYYMVGFLERCEAAGPFEVLSLISFVLAEQVMRREHRGSGHGLRVSVATGLQTMFLPRKTSFK